MGRADRRASLAPDHRGGREHRRAPEDPRSVPKTAGLIGRWQPRRARRTARASSVPSGPTSSGTPTSPTSTSWGPSTLGTQYFLLAVLDSYSMATRWLLARDPAPRDTTQHDHDRRRDRHRDCHRTRAPGVAGRLAPATPHHRQREPVRAGAVHAVPAREQTAKAACRTAGPASGIRSRTGSMNAGTRRPRWNACGAWRSGAGTILRRLARHSR